MITQKPKGTKDIVGEDVNKWLFVEKIIRQVCENFSYGEIRTPIFEHTELFLRGVGETSDVVQKEMYTFMDKGNRSITLKPENTAGVARAYLENNLYAGILPARLYYISPCFRYEKPQAGRFREFNQFGVETFGTYSPACDVEVISLAYNIINKLGIKGIVLNINSLGGNECRANYNKVLKNYIGENIEHLCEDCKSRYEANPLRVLDCKKKNCKDVMENAPDILDNLGEECITHFETVKELLKEMNIPFVVNSKIVRGLDYYTQTIFEFISDDIGTQGTVCGGGRYNNLIEEFGGSETGAVGFGMGIERIIMVMESQGLFTDLGQRVQLYLGAIGEKGFISSQTIAYKLKCSGINVLSDISGKSVKAQLKYADKIGAKFSCVLGDDEILTGNVTVKNMETGEKIETTVLNLVDMFK